MPNALGRLMRLGRGRSVQDQPSGDVTVDDDEFVLEDEELGPPPMLRPAAIFRKMLFDPTESPVWARPRLWSTPVSSPQSGPKVPEATVSASESTDEPKPNKRTRRPKATGTPSASRTGSKRAAKPGQIAADG